MDKTELYKKLHSAWLAAYPDRPKSKTQNECNLWWNENKSSDKIQEIVSEKISELKQILCLSRSKISAFFKPVSIRKSTSAASSSNASLSSATDLHQNVDNQENSDEPSNDPEKGSEVKKGSVQKCPGQDAIKQQLSIVKSDLNSLFLRDNCNLATENDLKKMKELKNQKLQLEGQLKTLEQNRKRQQETRLRRKRAMDDYLQENPELAPKLKSIVRENRGRPSIVETQSSFLETIVKIATYGGAADAKRRCEVLRTIKTLEELTEELRREGFNVGRSTVYYHLAPRNSKTIDGRKHVTTVPVRLIKAAKDMHKSHPDSKFCTATIENIRELASLLGPAEVAVVSQDDKAKVPIGLPAASLQAPLLMHLEYKIKLPDHDFVIAPRHKLTPSVYAALKIEEEGYGNKKHVSYSGPTYISIRSAKQSQSTALSHAKDFARLYEIDSFKEYMLTKEGLPKPLVILFVDGGPDENPRYQKSIEVAIHNFVEYSLDSIIIATNAPGRSAFNPVERRMAPLSRQLSGLILPHEQFGSHLDDSGKTIDENLERVNFQHAGEVLSEVFSNTIIDGFEVHAEFIPERDSELHKDLIISKSHEWISTHVRSTQYMTQVAKCHDESCCGIQRGKFLKIFPDRFIPPPTTLRYNPMITNEKSEEGNFKFTTFFQSLVLSPKGIPYDQDCPSLADQLNNRICEKCKIYFASLTLLKNHKKCHPTTRKVLKKTPKNILRKKDEEVLVVLEHAGEDTIEWLDADLVDENALHEIPNYPVAENIPIFSLDEHLQSLWENVELE